MVDFQVTQTYALERCFRLNCVREYLFMHTILSETGYTKQSVLYTIAMRFSALFFENVEEAI